MRVFLSFTAIVSAVMAQGGGMAELKSITGDTPYSGTGNAPAPLPQPMGFWGRPRIAPGGFGAGPYYGYNPYDFYGPDRFTSAGHSPYGALGRGPYRQDDSFFLAMMSFLDGASSPFDSRPSSPRRAPFSPSPVPISSQPLPGPTSDGKISLGGGGLGGFYKGSGN